MQDKNPDDTKNLILALVLSMAVLFLWQAYFMPPPPDVDPATTTSGPVTKDGSVSVVEGGAVAPDGGVVAGLSRSDALTKSPRVAIETPSLMGSLNLKGGRIDDLVLIDYHETVDPSSPNIVLFSPSDAPKPYFAELGWIVAPDVGQAVPNRDTVWTAEGAARLSADSPVTMTWNNGTGLTFKRTVSVDKNFMFSIKDEVENVSGKDIALHPYGRVYRYGTPKVEGFWIQHEGMIGWLGDEKLKEVDYSAAVEPGGSEKYKDVTGGWVGFTSKYWAATLVPDQHIPFTGNLKLASPARGNVLEAFQSDFQAAPVVIGAGQSGSYESQLFAGAKKVALIETYEHTNNILQFDYLIDWGWFDFITYPLYHLINWFYHLFGNFGVAILACTIVVKLAFFPLANKAYESMARMKALQPKMEELKARHGDDKAAFQKSMMELYQKEKVNPFAGCLPILLQIPVFFALYKVLFVSIDMRHAPFFGWIQDLSAPDPTSLFNLFGLLPFDVPGYLMVGVWPLLMGATMWIQMQLNPPQPDPAQQMVFNWMPVMFTFLLATFPAGLVIYWTWNNVLSIAQQWFIMKRQGVDVPVIENIKKTFAALTGLWPGGKPKDKTGA